MKDSKYIKFPLEKELFAEGRTHLRNQASKLQS